MNRSILITLVALLALLFLTHNVVQSAPSANRESESNELFDTRSVWGDVKKWFEGKNYDLFFKTLLASEVNKTNLST